MYIYVYIYIYIFIYIYIYRLSQKKVSVIFNKDLNAILSEILKFLNRVSVFEKLENLHKLAY